MADKEAALVALKTRLETITTGNGYPFNVKKVTRQFKTIKTFGVKDFPALIIEDDGSEEIDFKTGGTSGLAGIEAIVNIIGYVSGKNDISTRLNELDAALVKAIHSEQTLGGAVGAIAIEPTTDKSGSKFTPYGFFVRPVRLFYEVQLSSGI